MKIILSTLVLAMAILFSGCAKSADPTPDAGARDAFLGKWSVTETWTKLTYEVNITADPVSSTGVFIYNFAGTGAASLPAGAEVTGTTILLDPDQIIGTNIKINGSGGLVGTKITWNYTLDDGANLIHAVATYTKL